VSSTIELLRVAESKALEKSKGDKFYIRDTQVFFKEFKENVLEKFDNEQSTQDIFNLTQPDYSAIFLMFKKYSYLQLTIDDNEQFVMRFIYALSSIEETFFQEVKAV